MKRGVVPNPTDLLDSFARIMDKSKVQWDGYNDLEWNHEQKHREDLPKTEMAYELQNALREIVDELMRMEIERLQAALDRDRGKFRKIFISLGTLYVQMYFSFKA